MPDTKTPYASRNWLGLMGAAVFFGVFAAYVRIVIDPKVVYAGFGLLYHFPMFHADWAFFRGHLSYPGDITEYVSALLSQGYYWSWLGTIILTVLALSLWAGMRAAIRLAGAPRAAWLAYLLPILLLVSCNACDHPLTAAVALSVAVWLAVGAVTLAPRNTVPRTIFLVAAIALGYWLVASVVLVAVFLIWILDGLARKHHVSGWLALVLGLAVPWTMGRFLFDEVMPMPYLILSPQFVGLELWRIAAVMYLTVVLGTLLAMIWHKIATWRRDPSADRAASLPRRPWVAWCAEATLLAVVAAVGLTALADAYERRFLRMVYHSRRGEWDDVLALARAMPADHHDGFTAYLVERALYRSGKLGEESLAYAPWVRDPGSGIRKAARGRCAFFLRAELLLDLGDVNGAEWQASEALENCGDVPRLLEMLARLSAAKGYPQTARVYLAAMARDPIAGARGRRLLQCLDKDPALSTDPEVVRLRKVMTKEDFVLAGAEGRTRTDLLLELLRQSPGNRAAAAFLLAYYLEFGQLDEFVQSLRRFDALVDDPLPRHYAEALLLHARLTRRPLDLGDRRLPEGTADRIKRFDAAIGVFSYEDRLEAKRSLAAEFGDTYWFHHTFRKVSQAQ